MKHVETLGSVVDAGVYVTAASSPAYGVLLGFVTLGLAAERGVRYSESGEKLIAVEVFGDHRANMGGSIRIGREFFTGAIKDYEDWQEKWWREAIQNAVDAGATQIDCGATDQGDGTFRISVQDNGGGMDEDVLLNKFLVLGGTTKVVGSTTGGFGKAKELLVLPWLSWEIHTRDRLVRGSGIDYEVTPAEFLHGTRLTVIMPADQTTHEAACLSYIGKCDLQPRFTVNDKPVSARLRTGDLIRSFGDAAALYYDKRKRAAFAAQLLVRANGLYMFSRYVPSSVPGQIIVELTRPSIELLTANRDGFRDRMLGRGIDDYVNELSANVISALRKKSGLVREKFIGTGKFSAQVRDDLQASAYEAMGSLDPIGEVTHGGRRHLSQDQVGAVVRVVQRELPTEVQTEAGPMRFAASSELASELLAGVDLAGPTQVEAAVKQLMWEPDFYLINEVEGFRVPKKFYPETMTHGVRKIARFWAELCRFVLMQLGSSEPYGIGFQFDLYARAAYLSEERQNWLLLNPFIKQDPTREGAELFRLSDWDHVMQLYASAVHECTHMADGISYHDESFAAALTRNFARASGKEKQIRRIKRIVARDT